MKCRTVFLAATSLSALTVLPMTALAQSKPAASETDEGAIVVTARKREEKLQDVPIAISVLNAEAIARKGIDGPADVANQTPGLTFDVGLVPSDTKISIRGLQAARGRPNVAILVDGIDTSSENFGVAGGGILANLRLVDVERIEVVKGPQSVLYGRSAFAGAINYITKRPGDTFEGEVSGSYGSYQTFDLKGAVGGPIGGGLSARINAGYWNTDGDYLNPNTKGRLNAGKVYGGALGLQYEDGNDFTAYARVSYSKEKYSERASVFLSSVNPITGLPNTADGGTYVNSLVMDGSFQFPRLYTLNGDVSQSAAYKAQRIDLSGDPRNGGKPFDGTNVKTLRATLNLEKDFGSWTAASLTGFTDNKGRFSSDFDHTNAPLQANTPNLAYQDKIIVFPPGPNLSALDFYSCAPCLRVPNGFQWPFPFLPSYGLSAIFETQTDIKQLNQEVRFSYEDGNTRLLLDGLYWHEKAVYQDSSIFYLREGANAFLAQYVSLGVAGRINNGGYHLAGPTFPANRPQQKQRISRTTNSYSFAASLEQRMGQLTAALEGRIIYDEIAYTGRNFDPTFVNTYGIIGPGSNPTEIISNKVTSSKFAPRASLSYNNDRGLLLFATYAKGTKPGGVDTTDQNGNVADGVFFPEKVDSFELGGKFVGDNRRLTVNASLFYNIYKDQQIGTIQGGFPSISTTLNIGESKTKGFEVETLWTPIDSLSLRAAYTHTRAKFTDYIVRPRCSPIDSAETQTTNCSFNGKFVPFTPKHQLNVSARFETAVSGDNKAYFEVDSRFVAKRFMSANNRFWLPSYTQTDMRAGVMFGKISVDAWVENVFKNTDPRTGSSTVNYGYLDAVNGNLPRGAIVALAPRRTFGMRVGSKF
jgi:iron complex outermembrane recepter protein